MKKLATKEEFISLIKNMEHRERFVFSWIRQNQQIEIYSTVLNEGYGKVNICLTVINEDGPTKPQNKLLSLYTDYNFEFMYNKIL